MNPSSIHHREISVIVQGAVDARFTPRSLASIRKILPGATIILSTWAGSNVEGLDYDVLVENKDPGQAMLGGKPANYFRQIVSTLNGLKAAKTKYAMKLRSDMALEHDGLLAYFIKFNQVSFDREYKILKERIVTFTTHDPRRNFKQPFHVSDWLFFGLTEDLIDVFDIPLIETDRVQAAEQYIWLSFLSKHKQIPVGPATTAATAPNIKLSERYFANNCIFLTGRRAGVASLSRPGGGYTQTPALSDAGYYTFNDYKRMLNRYAGAHLTIIPNPAEAAAYALSYNAQKFFREKVKPATPKLYDFLRKTKNKFVDTANKK